MKQEIYDLMIDNPIIVALKNDDNLKTCLTFSDQRVVFLLYGSVAKTPKLVKQLKDKGHVVFVHVDLVNGLSAKEDAVDFIKEYTEADGIISTKLEQIKRGRLLGLSTIYRIFVIDSKALNGVNRHLSEYADAIEILPGLMPKVIRHMTKSQPLPVIAGGLITDKEDVIQALNAGASAISTTKETVWNL